MRSTIGSPPRPGRCTSSTCSGATRRICREVKQQLVQIARTMVRSPRVLLLDEPFAPLDEHLRSKMRAEIRMLQRGYGVTTVMATNDPSDAMALASLIVVLDGSPAHVVQFGTPADLHDEPATIDVASATGSLWTLPVRVESDGDGFWLVHDDAVRLRSWTPALRDRVGRTVTLGVRTPQLVRDERGEATATLRRVIPGSETSLLCTWGGRMVTATGTATADDVGRTHPASCRLAPSSSTPTMAVGSPERTRVDGRDGWPREVSEIWTVSRPSRSRSTPAAWRGRRGPSLARRDRPGR